MAPVDLQAAPQLQSRLLSLPAEIQLIIFEYAFSRSPGFDNISKAAWHSRERWRKTSASAGSAYIKRAFPGPFVSNMMISKEFFALAAGAFVRSAPVKTTLIHGRENDLFLRFAETLVCSVFGVFYARAPSANIKILIIELTRSLLQRAPNTGPQHIASDDDTSEDELEKEPTFADRLKDELLSTEDFFGLKYREDWTNLSSSTMVYLFDTEPSYTGLTAAQRGIWHANIETYAEYLRSLGVNAEAKLEPAAATVHRARDLASPSTATAQDTTALSRTLPAQTRRQRATPSLGFENDQQDQIQVPRSPPSPTALQAPSPMPHNLAGTKRSRKDGDRADRDGKRVKTDDSSLSSVSKPDTSLAHTQRDGLTYGALAAAVPAAKTSRARDAATSPSNENILTLSFSPSTIFPQLERWLDNGDPSMARWVSEMQAKGKI